MIKSNQRCVVQNPAITRKSYLFSLIVTIQREANIIGKLSLVLIASAEATLIESCCLVRSYINTEANQARGQRTVNDGQTTGRPCRDDQRRCRATQKAHTTRQDPDRRSALHQRSTGHRQDQQSDRESSRQEDTVICKYNDQ